MKREDSVSDQECMYLAVTPVQHGVNRVDSRHTRGASRLIHTCHALDRDSQLGRDFGRHTSTTAPLRNLFSCAKPQNAFAHISLSVQFPSHLSIYGIKAAAQSSGAAPTSPEPAARV